MRFIPDYRVCYKGRFYECDEEFDIDEKDAEEMSEHGEIVDDPTHPAEDLEIKEPEKPAEEKPRRGRLRRAEHDESGEDAASDE